MTINVAGSVAERSLLMRSTARHGTVQNIPKHSALCGYMTTISVVHKNVTISIAGGGAEWAVVL